MLRLALGCFLLSGVVAASSAASSVASSAASPGCDGSQLLDAKRPKLSLLSYDFLKRYWSATPRPTCGAFSTLLRQMAGEEKRFGFRLEDARAPDRKQAEANLEKALKDPDVKTRLDAIASLETDPALRLAQEAAVLDDEGYFGASYLKALELQERLK